MERISSFTNHEAFQKNGWGNEQAKNVLVFA
jgi:hypothetical protein